MKEVYEALAEPDRKRELNRRLFDRIAPKYGVTTRALSLGRDGAWKRDLVAALPAGAPRVCVDLATGTGDIAGLLRGRYPGARIVGVDLSEGMIAQARARFAGEPGMEFLVGDMGQLPLEDGVAELVTGGYALRNVPDLAESLREIRRVLRPGGMAGFLEFVQPRAGWRRVWHHGLLHLWGGLVGLAMHGQPWIYRYIPASLAAFPDEDELPLRLGEAGLERIGGKRYLGGMVERLECRRVG